jgi:heterodisulfide reductase subunit A
MEKLGIRPERLQLEWISAAEGSRFAQIMRDLEEMRKKVTPKEIKHTKNVLADESATQDENNVDKTNDTTRKEQTD